MIVEQGYLKKRKRYSARILATALSLLNEVELTPKVESNNFYNEFFAHFFKST